MKMEEEPVIYQEPEEVKPTLDNSDNIEMLDDFIIPSVKDDKAIEKDDFLSNIIQTIRGLHLDSDKVKVEETNLPHEYHINIKIKKDQSNNGLLFYFTNRKFYVIVYPNLKERGFRLC